MHIWGQHGVIISEKFYICVFDYAILKIVIEKYNKFMNYKLQTKPNFRILFHKKSHPQDFIKMTVHKGRR